MFVQRKDIGLCSFAYRYAVGTAHFQPANPMTPLEFVREAERLRYGRVLFFDNLGTDSFTADQCAALGTELARRNLTSCLGIRHLAEDTFTAKLPLALMLGADCLRLALQKRDAAIEWAIDVLRRNLPVIEEHGLVIGMENHFSLPPAAVEQVVETIDHPLIRYIYDATNSLCHLERPEETLERFGRRLYAMHVKDFVFEKLEAGYLVNGTAPGEGAANLPALLQRAHEYNHNVKFELELSIVRPAGLSPEQVIGWERETLEKSTKNLFALLGERQEKTP